MHIKLKPKYIVKPEDLSAFISMKSLKDLCDCLRITERGLSYLAYRNTTYDNYRLFFLRKKNGGVRVIQAPEEGLKKAQSRLNRLLNHFYASYAPPAAHGFTLNRSIVTNAQVHVGKPWVLNCDLADFYGSITAKRVYGLFRSSPFHLPAKVTDALMRLCVTRTGLPQGAPTSSSISNMIAYELDHRLMKLAEHYGYDYTRYADDITFSSHKPFPTSIVQAGSDKANPWVLGEKLTAIIEDCGFRVNPDKTRLQSHRERQVVTGLSVNQKVNVDRKYIRNVRAMIYAYHKDASQAVTRFHDCYEKKPRYLPEKQHYNGSKRNFWNVLAGKLLFIKMVRGANDPVYLKLLASAQGELCRFGLMPIVNISMSNDIHAIHDKSAVDSAFLSDYFVENGITEDDELRGF